MPWVPHVSCHQGRRSRRAGQSSCLPVGPREGTRPPGPLTASVTPSAVAAAWGPVPAAASRWAPARPSEQLPRQAAGVAQPASSVVQEVPWKSPRSVPPADSESSVLESPRLPPSPPSGPRVHTRLRVLAWTVRTPLTASSRGQEWAGVGGVMHVETHGFVNGGRIRMRLCASLPLRNFRPRNK